MVMILAAQDHPFNSINTLFHTAGDPEPSPKKSILTPNLLLNSNRWETFSGDGQDRVQDPETNKHTVLASASRIAPVREREDDGAIHHQCNSNCFVSLELGNGRPDLRRSPHGAHVMGHGRQPRRVVPEETIAFEILEQVTKRLLNHEQRVEARQAQLAIRESLVDLVIDFADTEDPFDKRLPVVKVHVIRQQIVCFGNAEVALVRDENYIRVHEAHRGLPELAVLARPAIREFRLASDKPCRPNHLKVDSIGASFRARKMLLPELRVKKISWEWFDEDLILAPEKVCIHLLGYENLEAKSLLVVESLRRLGLAKDGEVG